MHLFGPTTLGIAILLLLGALLVVKQAATGSVLDKPQGGLFLQLVNIFNLFFLLIVNMLSAIGLVVGRLEPLDPTHEEVRAGWALTALESAGWLLYAAGFALMIWALLTLRRNYQLGGTAPRAGDRLIADGPYGLIRHPMYSAALSIALGLTCLTQSVAFLVVFALYAALMFALIPMEERALEAAYGAEFAGYKHKTRMLIPAIL